MYLCFIIYLWNDDQMVNEVWMYLEIILVICLVIELCYCLLFYLYILLWQVYVDDELMLCLIFFDYQYDVQIFVECDDFLLGCDLLVVSVVELGVCQCEVWLLDNQVGWYDFYSYQWFVGGQWVMLDVLLEKLLLLVCVGVGLLFSECISYVDV